jgi:tetratricopeptide (TPR) repeat protein
MSYTLMMSDHDSNGGGNHAVSEQITNAVKLTRAGDYAAALGIFETHLSTLASGDLAEKRTAAAAFSYFGLCIAMVRRRYAEAVKYCNISLKTNFLDPDHRYNFALVYLERNERKKAVETLNAGLRVAPDNTRITVIFESLGRRKSPPIVFLPRDNFFNIFFGKLRRSSKESG